MPVQNCSSRSVRNQIYPITLKIKELLESKLSIQQHFVATLNSVGFNPLPVVPLPIFSSNITNQKTTYHLLKKILKVYFYESRTYRENHFSKRVFI